MAEQDDDELEPGHETLPPEVQAMLRQGRKAQRDAEAAKAELAKMQRQAAVTAAGIPASPLVDLVFKDYDGPLDPESIKARAGEYGLAPSQAAPAAPVALAGPSAEEMAAQRQILQAGAGAPAGNGDIDLAVALRNAKSSAEVLEIVAQVQGQPGFKNRDGLIGVLPEF